MLITEMIIIPVAMVPIALNYWGVIHTHFERSLLAILLMKRNFNYYYVCLIGCT